VKACPPKASSGAYFGMVTPWLHGPAGHTSRWSPTTSPVTPVTSSVVTRATGSGRVADGARYVRLARVAGRVVPPRRGGLGRPDPLGWESVAPWPPWLKGVVAPRPPWPGGAAPAGPPRATRHAPRATRHAPRATRHPQRARHPQTRLVPERSPNPRTDPQRTYGGTRQARPLAPDGAGPGALT
jgi:hypothetical protein